MEKKFSSDELPLAELLGRAEHGELQLPDFQRGWVWDDEHIRQTKLRTLHARRRENLRTPHHAAQRRKVSLTTGPQWTGLV